MASPGTGPRTRPPRRLRALLLVSAALNLVPPVGFALSMLQVLDLEQFSLMAGTGSLAAALCTLYALHLASRPPVLLPRGIRLVLGAVALLAAVLFTGGDALVRALTDESAGPGLIPFMGMLLHLSAAATLLTLAMVHRRPRTAAPWR
ncbi:hypothetical protein [Nesterenkonia sp. CF4.4]|uniref:hypothetical protein n=1 Tax=Nesterenkonia sp. CF4.4 TaxID=3373079 RepID=UPI003EE4DE66